MMALEFAIETGNMLYVFMQWLLSLCVSYQVFSSDVKVDIIKVNTLWLLPIGIVRLTE